MKQKWKPTQYIEISIHEIFAFQDKLDAIKDNPEKVWDVVDDFFMEAESQLELSPNFLRELQELDIDNDFVPLSIEDEDRLFDDEDFEANETTAKDYINYVLYCRKKQQDRERAGFEKFQEDIPFSPRLHF